MKTATATKTIAPTKSAGDPRAKPIGGIAQYKAAPGLKMVAKSPGPNPPNQAANMTAGKKVIRYCPAQERGQRHAERKADGDTHYPDCVSSKGAIGMLPIQYTIV